MRLIIILLVATFLTTSAAVATAQQSVVADVKAKLVAAGQQWHTNCDAFEITRRVACRTGASLIPKFGSQNGCYPPGHPNGYSHDAIAFGPAPAGPWFDVLVSAGPDANVNGPTWSRTNPYPVALVQPWSCNEPETPALPPVLPPPPVTEPQPPAPPAPLPAIDLSPFLNSQQVLAYKIGELQTLIETLRAELRAFVEHEDQRWAKVNAAWKKVLAIVGAAGPAIVTAILKLTGK